MASISLMGSMTTLFSRIFLTTYVKHPSVTKMLRTLKFAGVILAIILLCTVDLFYFIDEAAGCTMLWNEKEAYLFVNIGQRGGKFTVLGHVGEIARKILRGSSRVDDQKSSVLVLRLTSDTIQRNVIENTHLILFTPIGGAIYANNDGALWKCAGTHFEPVSKEEEARLGGRYIISADNFSHVNGWSSRIDMLSQHEGEVVVHLLLAGKPLTIISKRGPRREESSIVLLPTNGAPIQLFYNGEQPRRVSRAVYKQTFAKH